MSLHLEGVSKVVEGVTHLADVTLRLESGRLYVLLGPTLAGKTSLMRVMAGLDRPSRGRIKVDGKDVTGMDVRKRNVAMVYQQFINYPSFTVYDNIASPLRIKGLPKAEIDEKVKAAAARVSITPMLNRLPAELSGGQQQRCAIARSLVKEAQLLLLDEPLVNLDYKLREELREELQELFSAGETTVVYATTEPMEALIMGGEVIVMGEGRVLQQGPTAEVFHEPGSIGVARVFSDPPMNLVEASFKGDEAIAAGDVTLPLIGHLQRLHTARGTLGVRANHLFLQRRKPSDVEIRGTVEMFEISGSETFVHLRHGPVEWVVQEEGVHEHEIGEEVSVFADPARFYAFADEGTLLAAPDRAALAG